MARRKLECDALPEYRSAEKVCLKTMDSLHGLYSTTDRGGI